jgi:HlyD family secretion protein
MTTSLAVLAAGLAPRWRGRARAVARYALPAAVAALSLQQIACRPGHLTDASAGEAVAALVVPTAVTALGRIEPKNRIQRIAGPSRPSVVIATLLVEEGDRVEAGQPVAILDTRVEDEAALARAQAQMKYAQRTLDRMLVLAGKGIAAVSERDDAQLAVDLAAADVRRAEAALALATVRAPAAGQIVAIHARSGERVGPEGIAELAENDAMYAVAEVYETDIGRVQVGQRATIHSPALPSELSGTVERIGMKIGKLDVLDTDPVARTDARVVEVRIRLDETELAATRSNLQVEVTILPTDETASAAAPAGGAGQ